jgi:hypothetical protein
VNKSTVGGASVNRLRLVLMKNFTVTVVARSHVSTRTRDDNAIHVVDDAHQACMSKKKSASHADFFDVRSLVVDLIFTHHSSLVMHRARSLCRTARRLTRL